MGPRGPSSSSPATSPAPRCSRSEAAWERSSSIFSQPDADRATNVELSGEYEEEAAKLIDERGLSERVDRRVADFVTEPVEPADVVVMHRVVCCYPDVDRLVGAAAAHTRRRLLLTYPRERPWTRLASG